MGLHYAGILPTLSYLHDLANASFPFFSKLFEAVNGAVPEGLVRTIASVLVV